MSDGPAKKPGNKSSSGEHPEYSIIMIGKDTEKSPEHLRKLAVN